MTRARASSIERKLARTGEENTRRFTLTIRTCLYIGRGRTVVCAA